MARMNFKQTGGILRGLLLMIIGLVVMLVWLFQPPADMDFSSAMERQTESTE